VPFYGESSMLYYRKDLFKAAGLTMPAHPTWAQVAVLRGQAQPARQDSRDLPARPGRVGRQHGVPGHGGQHLRRRVVQHELAAAADLPAFEAATNFYVNLIRKDGEAGASNDSFNQLLTLYGQGKCAMWYDSTVAATSITGSFPSIAAQTGYAFAPVDKTTSSGWLWSWSLGIPQGTANAGAAWKFASWATSKQYDSLVASKYGWAAVPPGSRTSLYNNPSYLSAAKAFAPITLPRSTAPTRITRR
jgi:sorbitol/mannitol transport system substrate-binding protein